MKKKVTLKGLWNVLKRAGKGFGEDKVTKKCASLAYYTVFSLGPLLLVIIFLASLFFGRDAVEGSVATQLESFLGSDTAATIQNVIKNASLSGKQSFAAVTGIVTLLIGATTMFGDMQDSINSIWGLKPKPKAGIMKLIKDRLLSFGVIGSLAFLLLVSLLASVLIEGLSDQIQRTFPGLAVVLLSVINLILNFVIISALFTIIFKILPDAKMRIKDVLPGGIATAVLFMIGKLGINFYIGRSDVGSTYGAAGSIVVLLLWIYYSTFILYFGAEFTKAYAMEYGHDIRPNEYSVIAKTHEVEIENGSLQQAEKDFQQQKNKNP